MRSPPVSCHVISCRVQREQLKIVRILPARQMLSASLINGLKFPLVNTSASAKPIRCLQRCSYEFPQPAHHHSSAESRTRVPQKTQRRSVESNLQPERIEQLTARVRRPQSNNLVERARRTLLDEPSRTKGRETWCKSIDKTETDLDDYLNALIRDTI